MPKTLNYDAFVKIAASLDAAKSAFASTETSNATGAIQMPNTHSVESEAPGTELNKALKDNAVAPTVNEAATNPESKPDPAKGVGLNADSPDKKKDEVAETMPDPGTTLGGAETGKVAADYASMSLSELTAAYQKSANTLLAAVKADSQKVAAVVPPVNMVVGAQAPPAPATSPIASSAAAGYADATNAGPTAKMAASQSLAKELLRLGVLGGDLVVAQVKAAMASKRAEGMPPPGDPMMDAPSPAGPPAGPAGPPDGGPPPGADAGGPMGGPPPGADAGGMGGPPPGGEGGGGGGANPEQIITEFLSAMAEMGITPEQVAEIIEKQAPAASPPPESAPKEEKEAWAVKQSVAQSCKKAMATRNAGQWTFEPAKNSKSAETRKQIKAFLVELTGRGK